MHEAGWIHEPQPKHVCILPTQVEMDKRFEGAVWCCGECGAYYEVFYDTQEKIKQMRSISPALVESRMTPNAV
jgi:ribosomal protein L37AE/L43A